VWVTKGRHKTGDRYNFTPKLVVRNGDVIRLEHYNTQKNLHSHTGIFKNKQKNRGNINNETKTKNTILKEIYIVILVSLKTYKNRGNINNETKTKKRCVINKMAVQFHVKIT
jgi:dolichyl-phosphate-mannose--protein O-mannosyl transferase